MTRRTLFVALLAHLMAACEVDPPARSPSSEACAQLPRWEELRETDATLEHTFGLEHDPSGLEFGRITDVAVGRSGRLFVSDGLARQVVGIERGEEAVRIGKEGDGPGEFRYPLEIRVLEDGTLVVFDVGLWRISHFSPEGDLLAESHPEPDADFGQNPEAHFNAAGTLYSLGFDRYQESLVESLRGRRGLGRGRVGIRRWNTEPGMWQRVVETDGPQVYVDLSAGAIVDVLGAKRTLWDVSPAGTVFYMDTEAWELRAMPPIDTLSACVVRGPDPPPSMPEAAVADFYAARDLPEDTPVEVVRNLRQVRRGVPLPETLPVADRLVADEDGGVWVRLTGEYPPRESATWLWLTRDGRPPARVALPRDFRPKEIRPPRLWGVGRGPSGEPIVEVYRVGPL